MFYFVYIKQRTLSILKIDYCNKSIGLSVNKIVMFAFNHKTKPNERKQNKIKKQSCHFALA